MPDRFDELVAEKLPCNCQRGADWTPDEHGGNCAVWKRRVLASLLRDEVQKTWEKADKIARDYARADNPNAVTAGDLIAGALRAAAEKDKEETKDG